MFLLHDPRLLFWIRNVLFRMSSRSLFPKGMLHHENATYIALSEPGSILLGRLLRFGRTRLRSFFFEPLHASGQCLLVFFELADGHSRS